MTTRETKIAWLCPKCGNQDVWSTHYVGHYVGLAVCYMCYNWMGKVGYVFDCGDFRIKVMIELP